MDLQKLKLERSVAVERLERLEQTFLLIAVSEVSNMTRWKMAGAPSLTDVIRTFRRFENSRNVEVPFELLNLDLERLEPASL